MNNFKKLFSLLVAFTFIFALALPMFAAEDEELQTTKGSLSISNALDGEEYSVYQIFDLVSYDATTGICRYTVNSAWNGFFESASEETEPSTASGLNWVTVDQTTGYASWKINKNTATELQAFAKAALDYASKQNIQPSKGPIKAAKNEGETTATVKFTDLSLGYYLVTSSVGTLCSLDTTNPDAIINEKNQTSTITKTVDGESFDIGDEITFTLSIKVEKDADAADGTVRNFKIEDAMSEGLSFTPNATPSLTDLTISVKRGETSLEGDDKPTPNAANSTYSSNGFKLSYDDGAIHYGDEITIVYKAKLNEKADIGGNTNKNTATLSYGAEQKTTVDTPVYTGKIVIDKVEKDKPSTKLEGAEFVLLNGEGKYYQATKDADNKITEVKWVETQDQATTIKTDSSGAASFGGIKAGTYTLKETKAPEGYNILSETIPVTIYNKTTEANPDTDEPAHTAYITTAQVENASGKTLPSTGGAGTKIIIAVGAIMLVGAGVLLAAKRRMNIIDE